MALKTRILKKSPLRQSKEKKNEKKIKKLYEKWDATKWLKLYIIGVHEGEENGKGIENLINEMIAENFLSINRDIQMQEARRLLRRLNCKSSSPKHTAIKLLTLKTRRESKKWLEKSIRVHIKENQLD